MRNTATVQDGFASALGTNSWRLRDVPEVAFVNWTATYSTVSISQIASVSFDARRWDSSPSPAYTVGYSINRGSTFTPLASLNNAAFDNSSAWKTFSFLINTPVLADGDFVVRFASAGTTERIMIDNFSITAVPEPTSLVLVGLAGAGGLVARRWRKKKLVGVAT